VGEQRGERHGGVGGESRTEVQGLAASISDST
jgi:hypothetical protein